MKIYLETKDADNHRIAVCSDNGKLILAGEWVRRKSDARKMLDNVWRWMYQRFDNMDMRPIERPYKPGAFAKNAGPKSKSTTKKKK